jgi:hypothetical protein
MGVNKFDKPVTSPINISIKGKLYKSTKASTDFINKHKKTPSSRKMYNMNTNSIEYATNSSFHNSSILNSKTKPKPVKQTTGRKVGNMSILEKVKSFHTSSAHQKKKTTMTGFNNLNYLTSPRGIKKPTNFASSRMEVINLNKDQCKVPKKTKAKKLYGSNIVLSTKNTSISNELIASKKAKLLKPMNKSKDMANFGSFEETISHPIKLNGAYQIKPKRSRKKPNLSTAKFKNTLNLINYPLESSKSRKSSRKPDMKSSNHLKTKSIMTSVKTFMPLGKYLFSLIAF